MRRSKARRDQPDLRFGLSSEPLAGFVSVARYGKNRAGNAIPRFRPGVSAAFRTAEKALNPVTPK